MVGIARHDVAHEFPPALADLGAGDGGPAGLVLDLDVAKQLEGFRVEEDLVVVAAVRAQHGGEFVPDGLVTGGVFLLAARMDRHDEGFADHRREAKLAGAAVKRHAQSAAERLT